MKEFIPLCAGVLVGGSLAMLRSMRLRAVLLPLLSVVVGALASWANGELLSEWWALFVSFDALLVWTGAMTTFALIDRLTRTRRAAGG
jgi:hypothetical protein